jgi:glutamyl-Q tRNA(Asp) synthetase
VGDFVLQRADGLWAYQLAVVVDDAAQGITHVVRGQDLADNTARQIVLQRALGCPRRPICTRPLVLAADGHKLSKQNGAQALDLRPGGRIAGGGGRAGPAAIAAAHPPDWLAQAVPFWAGIIQGFALPPTRKTRDDDPAFRPAV